MSDKSTNDSPEKNNKREDARGGHNQGGSDTLNYNEDTTSEDLLVAAAEYPERSLHPISSSENENKGGRGESETPGATPRGMMNEDGKVNTAAAAASLSFLETSTHHNNTTAASVSSSADVSSTLDDSLSYNQQYNPYQLSSPRFQLTETVVEVPDQEPLDADAVYNCLNFVMEGRIFLKAALDLLTERDKHAPELGRNDPIIFKSGSLKKASHLMNGVWKVKYVEIRRGMFSYYENVSSSSASSSKQQQGDGHKTSQQQHQHQPQEGYELLRKDIPLEANACTCRAVKFHEKARNLTPTGAIFELAHGNQKRLWMAKTRADRQLWMQTITNAMVGGSVTRGDSFMDHNVVVWGHGAASAFSSSSHHHHPNDPRSHPYYKNDLRKYRSAQTTLKYAKSQSDYTVGLKLLKDHPLTVPVKWVAKQQQQQEKSLGMGSSHTSGGSVSVGGGGADTTEAVAFREETVDMSVDQLWRDMQRDAVTINGELFRGDAGHGPEQIVGALVRQLLGVGIDHHGASSSLPESSKQQQHHHHHHHHHHRSDLQESQALVYARDILLSGNRTRSGGDSYFCVNTLCHNPDLVVIVPNSGAEPEPIAIDVTEDETDVRVIEKSGWIKTRSKSQKEWRKLFFVLSEGTLSFYESALPRPHRLRGQIVLSDSTLSVSRLDHEFVLKLSKEGSSKLERSLMFSSEDRLLDWTYALECSTKMKSAVTNSAKKPNRRIINRGGGGGSGDAAAEATKVDILSLAEKATKEHAANLGLDEEIVENRLALFSRRASASMVISIRACTEYKVCTLDPTGDEQVDTWATIRAHFLQSFRLSGGSNGRIMRGEEIVRVSVADCIDVGQAVSGNHAGAEQDPISPNRRGQNLRIFRRFSTSEEVEEILKTPSVD